jgi:hypothetical protein
MAIPGSPLARPRKLSGPKRIRKTAVIDRRYSVAKNGVPLLRRSEVVDFNQANARAVAQSREQRGVSTRW